MKAYKNCNINNLDKFIHQNRGEIIDFLDGCLIDNFLIATKRGYIALLENYVNCWTSNYKLIFSTNMQEIYSIWDKLSEEAN